MKVILSEDVDNLGDIGETVNVAPGYARNYLFPRKLAVSADSSSAKQLEHEMRIIRKKEEKRRGELTDVAKQLEKLTIEIKMRAGEGDKLFGSVNRKAIADALAAMDVVIDRRKIRLDEPIKALGIYTVPLRLMNGVDAQLKVWVVGLEEEVSTETEEEAVPEVAATEEAVAEAPAEAEEAEAKEAE